MKNFGGIINSENLTKDKLKIYGESLLSTQLGWFFLAGGLAVSAFALREFLKQRLIIEMFSNFDNLKDILCKITGMPSITDTNILFEKISKNLEIIRIASIVAIGVFTISTIGVAIYSVASNPKKSEVQILSADGVRDARVAGKEPEPEVIRGLNKKDIKKRQAALTPIFAPLICFTGISVGVLLFTFTTPDFLPEAYNNFLKIGSDVAAGQAFVEQFQSQSNTGIYIALIVGGGLVITGLTAIIIQGIRNLNEKYDHIPAAPKRE